MAWHDEMAGADAVHPLWFNQETDPALDAANHVSAGKVWRTPSTGLIQQRNDANDGWDVVFNPALYALVTALTAVEDASIDADAALDARVDALESTTVPAFTALTDGATVTWATAGASVNNATLVLGGDRTLDITGAVSGATGVLIVTQDATGTRTLALPGLEEGGGLTLSTDAGAVDVLAWIHDGTRFLWTLGKGFA